MSDPVADALRVRHDGSAWVAEVRDGFDVFGIPHGGYLLGLAANAVLHHTGQPDIFTITCHYLRKAVVGPLCFQVTEVGGSRRFTTVTAVGVQDRQVVLSVMASVGDRGGISGPAWSGHQRVRIPERRLAPQRTESFAPPNISASMGLRLDLETTGFLAGHTGEHGRMRGVAHTDPVNQLTALIACDLTPPSVWNALGAKGWVPTVELTAHVRARPTEGPYTIDVSSNHVAGGFTDEDALVHDGTGTLVVQSRQLARWTNPPDD